ncbi:hypothetical protein CDAR_196961 [Caerostris darwini]|uniref:Uncharacterized protein n=1 Tax=Caerostris darwini TaxID=1538125 RepID=A0AAV4UNV4_9ARAC|nr:hypothetical protein CDAR_196961 [Caerostris darwini]
MCGVINESDAYFLAEPVSAVPSPGRPVPQRPDCSRFWLCRSTSPPPSRPTGSSSTSPRSAASTRESTMFLDFPKDVTSLTSSISDWPVPNKRHTRRFFPEVYVSLQLKRLELTTKHTDNVTHYKKNYKKVTH